MAIGPNPLQEAPAAGLSVYRLGAAVGGLAPRTLDAAAARLIGRFFRAFHPGVAAAVARHVAAADAHRGDGRRTSPLLPFLHFSQNIAEFFRLARGRGAALIDEIEVEGEEHVAACLESGRGTIFLSAHMGNWEVVSAWAAARGIPLLVVARPHPDPKVDAYFNAVRRRLGVAVFPLGGPSRHLYAHLGRGGVLAVLGDRDFTGSGRETAFLGRRAILPTGYLRLAQAADAWILPGRHRWDDRFGPAARSVLRCEPPFAVGEGQEGLHQAFMRCRDYLESIVAADPGAWTVFDPVLVDAEVGP